RYALPVLVYFHPDLMSIPVGQFIKGPNIGPPCRRTANDLPDDGRRLPKPGFARSDVFLWQHRAYDSDNRDDCNDDRNTEQNPLHRRLPTFNLQPSTFNFQPPLVQVVASASPGSGSSGSPSVRRLRVRGSRVRAAPVLDPELSVWRAFP